MAKYGTGKLYGTGWLYGADSQYITEVGNIPSTAALGMPRVSPGPVSLPGVGNIFGAEAFGTPRIFQIYQRLALTMALDSRRLRVSPARRHLMAIPQITRLQVTPDA